MTKFLSFILSSVLILCLAGCGSSAPSSAPSSTPSSAPSSSGAGSSNTASTEEAPPKNGVEIKWEDSQKGYLVHTSASNWSVSPSEEFSCVGDYYLKLPAYTVLYSKKDFAVYCYDENFSISFDIMERSGIEMIGMSAKMKNGSVTLAEDCFVRVSVKGEFSDLTVAPPEGKEGEIYGGDKATLIYAPVVSETTENLSGRESAVNYIFITDIHYNNSSNANGQSLINQVKAVTELANNCDAIDFVVVGGDTTTGMFETKDACIKQTTEVLEPLKNCKKPVFLLMGNHDDNSYHRFTYDVYYPERIVSDKDWNDKLLKTFSPKEIKHDKSYADSKYYYYDLAGKKTRVVCLDAMDYRAKYDKNGTISELPIKDASASAHVSKYWSGCSWWGYSDEQLRWLATDALAAPDDWDYIFVSHMGIDKQTNAYNYNTIGGSALRNIIGQFQRRGAIFTDSINADFSAKKGKILVYNFGHSHRELTLFSKDIKLWQICTSTASCGEGSSKPLSETSISDKTLGWESYDRVLGGESEACFDIVSADRNTVYKYGFGASLDKVMKYE